MTSSRIKYLVGIFMTVGLGLTVAAIIWFGASRAFEEGRTYICFFDESVQGLNIDSPVKYRGVPVGRVTMIRVADNARLIEVHVKLHPEYTPEQIKELVAFLKITGITGSMYIELNLLQPEDRQDAVRPEIKAKYPVLLTRSSGTQKMLASVDQILANLSRLDTQKISDDILRLVASLSLTSEKLNARLDDPRLDTILTSAAHSARKLETAMDLVTADLRKTSGLLDQAESLVRESRQGVRTGLNRASSSLDTVDAMLKSGTSVAAQAEKNMQILNQQLLLTSRNLVRVMENINDLLEKLQQRPSDLLFGSPPRERPLQ